MPERLVHLVEANDRALVVQEVVARCHVEFNGGGVQGEVGLTPSEVLKDSPYRPRKDARIGVP